MELEADENKNYKLELIGNRLVYAKELDEG